MSANPLIHKLSGYAPLSEDDVRLINELCSQRVELHPARSDIISDGDRPDFIHLILEGWAARYKMLPDGTRQITAFLLPGDFCDLHITVLAKMDHGILALTDCEVAYLDALRLDEITSQRSTLTKALWWMTLVDEAVLREWIVNSRRPARAGTAHLLHELYIRLRAVGRVRDNHLDLPLTQEELADAVGMTAVHMNRTLQDLRAEGLIKLRAGKLTVPDITALGHACGFDDSYLHLREGGRRGER